MLTERQLEIVLAVVYEYIRTGEPVGSRTLSRKFLKSHSAATIRNEMADLEEMGYFSQPHSSAGRLPTSMAYRVYVNSILHRPSSPSPELVHWSERMSDQLQGLEERLSEATRFIGRFTQCFSVAAVKVVDDLRLQKVDFIRLSSHVVLLLIVLEGGTVYQKRIRIKNDIRESHLEDLTRMVNRIASGQPWGKVREELNTWLEQQLSDAWSTCREAFEPLDHMMSSDGLTLSTGGLSEVYSKTYSQEEASSRDGQIQVISAFLNERKNLETFIHDYAPADGLQVTIGEENRREQLHDCSVVMSTASEGGKKAVVGLIGPLRMNYEHSIAVLKAVLDGISASQNVID